MRKSLPLFLFFFYFLSLCLLTHNNQARKGMQKRGHATTPMGRAFPPHPPSSFAAVSASAFLPGGHSSSGGSATLLPSFREILAETSLVNGVRYSPRASPASLFASFHSILIYTSPSFNLTLLPYRPSFAFQPCNPVRVAVVGVYPLYPIIPHSVIVTLRSCGTQRTNTSTHTPPLFSSLPFLQHRHPWTRSILHPTAMRCVARTLQVPSQPTEPLLPLRCHLLLQSLLHLLPLQ